MNTYTPDHIRGLIPSVRKIVQEAMTITHSHRRYFVDGTPMPERYYNRTERFGNWDYDTIDMSDAEVLRLRELRNSLNETLPEHVIFNDVRKPYIEFQPKETEDPCHLNLKTSN